MISHKLMFWRRSKVPASSSKLAPDTFSLNALLTRISENQLKYSETTGSLTAIPVADDSTSPKLSQNWEGANSVRIYRMTPPAPYRLRIDSLSAGHNK